MMLLEMRQRLGEDAEYPTDRERGFHSGTICLGGNERISGLDEGIEKKAQEALGAAAIQDQFRISSVNLVLKIAAVEASSKGCLNCGTFAIGGGYSRRSLDDVVDERHDEEVEVVCVGSNDGDDLVASGTETGRQNDPIAVGVAVTGSATELREELLDTPCIPSGQCRAYSLLETCHGGHAKVVFLSDVLEFVRVVVEDGAVDDVDERVESSAGAYTEPELFQECLGLWHWRSNSQKEVLV